MRRDPHAAQFFYQRDWDWALISCRPAAEHLSAIDSLRLWYAPWNNESLWCNAENLPPLPRGFDGSWGKDTSREARHECGGLLSLQENGVPIRNLDALGIYSRLMVNRTAPPNSDYLMSKAGFGKTRADGCVVGVNYSDPGLPLLTRVPAREKSWPR